MRALIKQGRDGKYRWGIYNADGGCENFNVRAHDTPAEAAAAAIYFIARASKDGFEGVYTMDGERWTF